MFNCHLDWNFENKEYSFESDSNQRPKDVCHNSNYSHPTLKELALLLFRLIWITSVYLFWFCRKIFNPFYLVGVHFLNSKVKFDTRCQSLWKFIFGSVEFAFHRWCENYQTPKFHLRFQIKKNTPSSRSRTSDLRMSVKFSNYSPPLYQLSYRRKDRKRRKTTDYKQCSGHRPCMAERSFLKERQR